MAGSKTVYLEKKLLDHVLGNVAYTAPGSLYVALSTLAFDPTLAGSALVEPSAGDYARLAVTNNTTNWPAAADGNPADKSNGTDLSFGTPVADWGTILSAYLCDASSAGNALYGADFSTGQVILSGVPFSIASGTWLFQET